ncbi:MAG: chalcone isomerase family protein [Deltaproteobacteria bacterium]|nr:chalcone isomerase family protein [Deltaproteobacteria bacterium]
MSLLLALLLSLSPALAGELAGVTMSDSATIAGQPLVLNGLGLREKYFLDIYVGGLYLPAKTHDGAAAIEQDVPKLIRMQFVYSSVPAAKMVATYEEGFATNPRTKGLEGQIATFLGLLVDMHSGDVMELEYAPGTGTTLRVQGKALGTIPGVEFMRLVFSNYIGPDAYGQLRDGMLGG